MILKLQTLVTNYQNRDGSLLCCRKILYESQLVNDEYYFVNSKFIVVVSQYKEMLFES